MRKNFRNFQISKFLCLFLLVVCFCQSKAGYGRTPYSQCCSVMRQLDEAIERYNKKNPSQLFDRDPITCKLPLDLLVKDGILKDVLKGPEPDCEYCGGPESIKEIDFAMGPFIFCLRHGYQGMGGVPLKVAFFDKCSLFNLSTGSFNVDFSRYNPDPKGYQTMTPSRRLLRETYDSYGFFPFFLSAFGISIFIFIAIVIFFRPTAKKNIGLIYPGSIIIRYLLFSLYAGIVLSLGLGYSFIHPSSFGLHSINNNPIFYLFICTTLIGAIWWILSIAQLTVFYKCKFAIHIPITYLLGFPLTIFVGPLIYHQFFFDGPDSLFMGLFGAVYTIMTVSSFRQLDTFDTKATE